MPILFGKHAIDQIVKIVIKWSHSMSDPDLLAELGLTPLPDNSFRPPYLIQKQGWWKINWNCDSLAAAEIPEGALLLTDAISRGVPEEEFRAMVNLAWARSRHGIISSLTTPEYQESLSYSILSMWIGARLGTGLDAETVAIVSTFYTEPMCGWDTSWQQYKNAIDTGDQTPTAIACS